MKFCHSQVNGWNWRTSSLAKLSRLRRPKIICSPSYVDYRPKATAVILWDIDHTLRENGYRRNRETEKNLKLESVQCAHC
jgi:hypothetical protein